MTKRVRLPTSYRTGFSTPFTAGTLNSPPTSPISSFLEKMGFGEWAALAREKGVPTPARNSFAEFLFDQFQKLWESITRILPEMAVSLTKP
jgi:hypothetical protein